MALHNAFFTRRGSVAGAGRKHGGGGVVAAQGAVCMPAPEAPEGAQAAAAADQQALPGRAPPRQPGPGIVDACSACRSTQWWDSVLACLQDMTG